MKRSLVLALAAGAALLASGAAQAGNVQWSIGINLPPIGTVVSNGPVYYPAPAPVYYPAPVYRPAPVVYPPVVHHAPVVVAPAPVWSHRGPPVHYRGGHRHVRPVVIVEPSRPGWHEGRRWDRWGDKRWDRDDDGRDHRRWSHR